MWKSKMIYRGRKLTPFDWLRRGTPNASAKQKRMFKLDKVFSRPANAINACLAIASVESLRPAAFRNSFSSENMWIWLKRMQGQLADLALIRRKCMETNYVMGECVQGISSQFTASSKNICKQDGRGWAKRSRSRSNKHFCAFFSAMI